MIQKERRKFPRIATDNLYSTIKFKESDTQIASQTERRIVNMSIAGLQIETKYPIKSKHVHLRVVDLEKIRLRLKEELSNAIKFHLNYFMWG